MNVLVSKVQFKISEKGEFHEIAERTLADTISLILNYPWDTERSFAPIKLTCPSITIEHPIGTYLKIGPYFSGKFSLYYLNTNNKVYLKIVNTLDDASVWIKAYFEEKPELRGFEKYAYTINASAHFQTNSFEYIIDRKATTTFFIFPILIVPPIFFMCWLKYLERPESFNPMIVVGMLLFLLLIFSPLTYLFFNYLSADKDNYLQISIGHDEFSYGTVDNKKSYSKENIAEINAFGIINSRSPWSECEVFIITFKNGEKIRFTSLIISRDKLRQKFPDHQIKDNKKFLPTVESI